MAVKTITIDLEAYDALSRNKRKGESFSDVIKAHFGRRKTAGELLRVVARIRVPEKTIDAIEEQIKARRRSPARAYRGLVRRVEHRLS